MAPTAKATTRTRRSPGHGLAASMLCSPLFAAPWPHPGAGPARCTALAPLSRSLGTMPDALVAPQPEPRLRRRPGRWSLVIRRA